MSVKPLLAKFIKFDFSTKVLSNDIFHLFADRWFEVIFINPVKAFNLVEINFTCTGKEAWNVLFKHGKSCIEIFENTDDWVLCLNDIFSSFQSFFWVKWSVMKVSCMIKERRGLTTYVHSFSCPHMKSVCLRWSPMPSCDSPWV